MVFLATAVLLMLSSFVFRFVISPPVDGTLESDITPETVEESIQIEILNGCDVQKLAGKSRDFMRQRKFDVVDISNAKDILDKSIVIDRVGDVESARKVAYAMGINDSLIRTDVDSSLYLRASVLIGQDYKTLNPFKK